MYRRKKRIPLYGVLGLLLMLLFWYLNWALDGLRTHWGFFPLWVGFCLTLDSIVYYLKGDSLFTRNYKKYLLLFVISIPTWWLFEIFNLRIQNWFYNGQEYFTNLEFFLLASISFSTVMPAVFTASEFTGTLLQKDKVAKENFILPTNKTLVTLLLTGLFILILILLLPDYFYFLIWIALYLMIDPVNVWMGNNNLIVYFLNKQYHPILALGTGSIICGFFWEMWNYYSYPKWEYYLPMVNFLHVFEMPVLGYTGYIPFAFELYALYNLVSGFSGENNSYLRI